MPFVLIILAVEFGIFALLALIALDDISAQLRIMNRAGIMMFNAATIDADNKFHLGAIIRLTFLLS